MKIRNPFFRLLLFFIFSNYANGMTAQFGNQPPSEPVNKKPELVTDAIYVTMPDGVRLAVDAVYPRDAGKTYPTILYATRYWRSFELRLFPSPPNRAPINYRGDLPDFFIQRGYAVAFLDVRGTGASEGAWSRAWSAEERDDLGHVINWIANQPWSNGKVATMGLSYEGTTALFAAAAKPKALKAAVVQQVEFDVYRDLVFPGGIFNEWFVSEWSEANKALDTNTTPSFFPWYARFLIKGPRAVGGDFSAVQSLIEKREIHDVHASMKEIIFRDDKYGASSVTQDEFSPFTYRQNIKDSGASLFMWGSWMDGSTADSVIRTFVNLDNPQFAVIGAWDHMTERQGSPYGDVGGKAVPNTRAQWEEMKAFLDAQLIHEPPAQIGKKLIYYTMGEEQWKQTETWPPQGFSESVLYFTADNGLSETTSDMLAIDEYKVDFEASSGTNNRWHTELNKKVDYGNRTKADKRLLTYTSAPLQRDMEITGYPAVDLFVQSSETDGAFYVYLEDMHPDGKVTYITDGQLRALHRKESDEEPPYTTFGPYRTFKRADAMLLEKDTTAKLGFALQPTSVLLRKGHRIRVAIAGHDKDTFIRIPQTGQPVIKLMRGGDTSSRITLPVMNR